MRRPRTAHPFINACFLILVTFLLVFPKGGIKLGVNIPLTHGYVLLALFSLPALYALLKRYSLSRKCAFTYGLTLPFQVVVLSTGIYYGFLNQGIMATMFTTLMFIPFVFLILFSSPLHSVDPQLFRKAIIYSIRFIAMYGIFLFFFRPTMGYFFEIPLLTVNLGDVGQLDTKMIQRTENVFKLISTYNNGNLYGICLLILFPLYYYLENSRLFLAVVILSLILTLSRTVWWGTFVAFAIISILNGINTRTVLAGAVFTLFMVFGILQMVELMKMDLSFVFDSSLGGRAQDLEIFRNFSLLPPNEIRGIAEITYAGVLISFGLVGLLPFLLFIGAPLLIFHLMEPQKTPLQRYAMGGLVTYLLVSISDGALVFIPTLAFYFATAIIMLEGRHLDLGRASYARPLRLRRSQVIAQPPASPSA